MFRIQRPRTAWLTTLVLVAAGAVARADQPKEIHFSGDSSALSAEAQAELDEAAAWIKENKTGVILIEGHAGSTGDKALSDRRAASAKIHLLMQGVDEGQIRILASGEAPPAQDTERGSRPNRRIVLRAVPKGPIAETRLRSQVDKVEVPAPVERRVYLDRPVAGPMPLAVATGRDLLGFDVLAGGGVTTFLDDHTNDVTDAGGMWTARVVGFTGSFVGFEAAYVGSAQAIDAIGVDDSATLLGNGVEGNLRINATRGRIVQPFVFAGLGWTHYSVTNTEVTTASIEEADDVLHVPAGLGLSVRFPRRVTLDVRGMYRAAAGDSMFHGAGEQAKDDGLESVSGTAQFGFTF